MKKLIIFFGTAVLLVACEATQTGIYAYRPNTTNQQKADSWLNCRVQATRAVPVSTQVGTTPAYTTPIQVSPTYTNCSSYGYSATCTTTGGIVTGGQTYGGNTYSYDANGALREQYRDQCMRKKGFALVDLPSCTKGQVPEGLTASLSDKILDPTGSSCFVPFGEYVAIPIRTSVK